MHVEECCCLQMCHHRGWQLSEQRKAFGCADVGGEGDEILPAAVLNFWLLGKEE